MGIFVEYGSTLYKPETLKDTVTHYHKTLCEILERDKKITTLVSTGSSGAVLVGALMMLELPRIVDHLHVCKPDGGSSHSGTITGKWYNVMRNARMMFVDDFISSGQSLVRCKQAILKVNEVKAKLVYALVAHGGQGISSLYTEYLSDIRIIAVGSDFSIVK